MSRNTLQSDPDPSGFPVYRDLCRADLMNSYRRRHGRNPLKEVEGIDEKPSSPAVATFNKKSNDLPYDPESPTGSPISDAASQLYYSRSSSVDESSSQENMELNGERSNTEPNQNRQISPTGQNFVINTNDVMQTDPSPNSESRCIQTCQPENSTLTANTYGDNSEAKTKEAVTSGLCPVMYDYAHGEARDNLKDIKISEITLPPDTPPPRPIPPEQSLSNSNQNYNASWDYSNFSNSWGNKFVTPPYGPWYGMQPPLPWMGGRGDMFLYFRYPFYQQPYDYNVGQYFAPQNYSYRPYCYAQTPPPVLPVPPPPLQVPPPPLPLPLLPFLPPPVPLPLTSPSKYHDTNGSYFTSIPASASAVFPQNHPNSNSSETNNNKHADIPGKTGESESVMPSQINAPQTNFVDPKLEAITSNSIYHDLGPKRQRLQCDTTSTKGAQSSTSCDSTGISHSITSKEPNISHRDSESAPQSSSSVGTDGNSSTAIYVQSLDQEQVVTNSVLNKSGVPHSGSGVLQGESESGEKSVSTYTPAAPVQVPVVKTNEYKDTGIQKEDISKPGVYSYAQATRYVIQGHRRLFDTLSKTDHSGNGRTGVADENDEGVEITDTDGLCQELLSCDSSSAVLDSYNTIERQQLLNYFCKPPKKNVNAHALSWDCLANGKIAVGTCEVATISKHVPSTRADIYVEHSTEQLSSKLVITTKTCTSLGNKKKNTDSTKRSPTTKESKTSFTLPCIPEELAQQLRVPTIDQKSYQRFVRVILDEMKKQNCNSSKQHDEVVDLVVKQFPCVATYKRTKTNGQDVYLKYSLKRNGQEKRRVEKLADLTDRIANWDSQCLKTDVRDIPENKLYRRLIEDAAPEKRHVTRKSADKPLRRLVKTYKGKLTGPDDIIHLMRIQVGRRACERLEQRFLKLETDLRFLLGKDKFKNECTTMSQIFEAFSAKFEDYRKDKSGVTNSIFNFDKETRVGYPHLFLQELPKMNLRAKVKFFDLQLTRWMSFGQAFFVLYSLLQILQVRDTDVKPIKKMIHFMNIFAKPHLIRSEHPKYLTRNQQELVMSLLSRTSTPSL